MPDRAWTQLNLFSPTSTDVPAAPSRHTTEESHRRRILGYLTIRLPDPVDLMFTDNRSTMISFAHRQGRYRIRLHRMFRHAEEPLLEHLARFITGKRKIDAVALDDFIADHKEEIDTAKSRRRRPLKETGEHHDLQSVLEKVSATYFNDVRDVRIGWGPAPRRRSKRRRGRTVTRALATYSYDDRTIRVNPVLDAADVPEYVVEWIVYHEMLHHVLPIEQSGGRNQYHTPRFRMLERAFKEYNQAKAWEETHLERLLR